MRQKLADKMMAEHVSMPGFPQLIVTRHFCYHWLKERGWSQAERGFGSLDYTVFARDAVLLPLTPVDERDFWLNKVASDYQRGEA
jgi:hypothetical protein